MKPTLIEKFAARLGRDRPSLGLGVLFALSNPLRLSAAIAGIAVAVLVMFVELGLLQSILQSQSRLASLVRGDLMVMSAARSSLHDWARLDRLRLAQLAAVSGVAQVIPVYESGMLLRNPPERAAHRITAFAFPAGTLPLAIGDEQGISRMLKIPGTVLFDRRSRPLYGDIQPGHTVLLNAKSYVVRGLVAIGPDIVSDGAVVMSEGSWLADDPGAQPIMGVLRLVPGAELASVRRALAAAMPADTTVMTPAEAARRERDFTLKSAPIGLIFGIGLLAGLLIGVVICYQILFNEIIDNAKEYATLRAMGFADSTIARMIFELALVLVAGGFVAGLAAGLLTDHLLAMKTGLGAALGFQSALLVAAPTAAIAVLASLLATRHLAAVEPAALY